MTSSAATPPSSPSIRHGRLSTRLVLDGTQVVMADGPAADLWRGADAISLIQLADEVRARAFLVTHATPQGDLSWIGVTLATGVPVVLERTHDGIAIHHSDGPCPEWFDLAEARHLVELLEANEEEGLWIWEPGSDRFRLSPRAAEFLGLATSDGATTLSAFTSRLPAADGARLRTACERAIATPDGRLETIVDASVGSQHSLRLVGRALSHQGVQRVLAGRVQIDAIHLPNATILDAVSSGSPDIIAIHDLSGALIELVLPPGHPGVPHDQSAGAWAFSFLHPDDRALIADRARQVAGGTAVTDQLHVRLATRDGSWPWHAASLRLARHPDGREIVVVNNWDIDTLKRAEAQLRVQRDELDVLVAERTRDLQTANDLLRQREDQLVRGATVQALGTLVTGVVHEIATPMQTAAHAIERALAGELPQRARAALERTRSALGHAQGVVDQLRETVRDHPMSSFATVDIATIAETALGLIEHALRRPGLQLVRDLPLRLGTAFASPRRLVQACVNLLLNAIQSLPPAGGTVSIAITADQQEARIIVADDGCGMSNEIRRRIGEPFFTTRTESGGIGLGVSVTMGIIQEHGGRLEFTSQPGRGTTATLILPHQLPHRPQP